MPLRSGEEIEVNMLQESESRIYFFDNLKAVLMATVVFGHILELVLTGKIVLIYQFIYLFHMPLFCFCSGYLTKSKPMKILTHLMYPYIVFQVLFCLFDKICLGRDTTIGFTTPYWILWYLFAMIVWSLLLPIIKELIISKKGMIITLFLVVLLGIVSGFDKTIGYYLSISRILYFLPFFVAGACVKAAINTENFLLFTSKWYVKCLSGVLTLSILIWLFFSSENIAVSWLYGSFTYSEGYLFTSRMLFYLFAVVISLFIMSVMPRRKMFFSYIGKRSIQIYLLHGFILRLLPKWNIFRIAENQYQRIFMAILISLFIVFVLSSGIIEKVMAPLFSMPFLTKTRKS